MAMPSLEKAPVYLAYSVTGLTVLMATAKFLMKMIRGDKLDAISTKATVSSYALLEGNIATLTLALEKQQKKINDLENRLDMLRDIELEGAADIASLTIYISQMPCGKCGAPADTFAHIEEILKRITDRRKQKQNIITGVE